ALYTPSLHDALPILKTLLTTTLNFKSEYKSTLTLKMHDLICSSLLVTQFLSGFNLTRKLCRKTKLRTWQTSCGTFLVTFHLVWRSEEHTSELQSREK